MPQRITEMSCPECGEIMVAGVREFICSNDDCEYEVDFDDLPDWDEIQDLSDPRAYEANARWRNR